MTMYLGFFWIFSPTLLLFVIDDLLFLTPFKTTNFYSSCNHLFQLHFISKFFFPLCFGEICAFFLLLLDPLPFSLFLQRFGLLSLPLLLRLSPFFLLDSSLLLSLCPGLFFLAPPQLLLLLLYFGQRSRYFFGFATCSWF
jgi:hypothetical protein